MLKKRYMKSRKISLETLIVGVDIGSREHSAYFTSTANEKLGSIFFANNRDEFDRLWCYVMMI